MALMMLSYPRVPVAGKPKPPHPPARNRAPITS
jgi:hypothetical protein